MYKYQGYNWAECLFCKKIDKPLERVETKSVAGKRGMKRIFYFHKSCYQNAIKSGTFWDFKI